MKKILISLLFLAVPLFSMKNQTDLKEKEKLYKLIISNTAEDNDKIFNDAITKIFSLLNRYNHNKIVAAASCKVKTWKNDKSKELIVERIKYLISILQNEVVQLHKLYVDNLLTDNKTRLDNELKDNIEFFIQKTLDGIESLSREI